MFCWGVSSLQDQRIGESVSVCVCEKEREGQTLLGRMVGTRNRERERERKKSANSLLGLLAHRVGFAVSLSGNIPFDISIRDGASQGTDILTDELAPYN